MKKLNLKNPVHAMLSSILMHDAIEYLFSDCKLEGVHLYFETQEDLDRVKKFEGVIKKKYPNIILGLRSRKVPNYELEGND